METSEYTVMLRQAEALMEDEPHPLPNLANISALIWQTMKDINWAGFYLTCGSNLLLGPFQGKPACIHIPFGKGVCGTAAAQRTVMLVEDVHAFPGHIACDSASRSELVAPLISPAGQVLGVLDIDSPTPGRFSAEDAGAMEELAALVTKACRWDMLKL